MSKAKQIGTAAETAVRNFVLSQGYTELEAHRNVLKGTNDEGDVWLREPLRGLIVFEVKGGKAAKEASYGQIEKWFQESQLEKKNANGAFGFLVTQRAGVGYPRAGEWWAYANLGDIIHLKSHLDSLDNTLVRIRLTDLIGLIRGTG